MTEPQNFYEYMQALPADSPVRVANKLYNEAVGYAQDDDASLSELMHAATHLRAILEDMPAPQPKIVTAYLFALEADVMLAKAVYKRYVDSMRRHD